MMDLAINKAAALVEALSYIQRFNNKIVVVKVGGSIMDDEQALSNNVLFAEKTYLAGEEGRRIDLGYVGEVRSVNARLLQLLVQADSIPCIASIARDNAGGRLNVNADTAAGAVAAAMKAEKLVIVSEDRKSVV